MKVFIYYLFQLFERQRVREREKHLPSVSPFLPVSQQQPAKSEAETKNPESHPDRADEWQDTKHLSRHLLPPRARQHKAGLEAERPGTQTSTDNGM